MENEFKYADKIKVDYEKCDLEVPVKNLIMEIFSLKNNRKRIHKSLSNNPNSLAIRRITKGNLKKAVEIFNDIYDLVSNYPNDARTPPRIEKLSKDLCEIIPFRYSIHQHSYNPYYFILKGSVLNDIGKLKQTIPILESLYALRVILNVLTVFFIIQNEQ